MPKTTVTKRRLRTDTKTRTRSQPTHPKRNFTPEVVQIHIRNTSQAKVPPTTNYPFFFSLLSLLKANKRCKNSSTSFLPLNTNTVLDVRPVTFLKTGNTNSTRSHVPTSTFISCLLRCSLMFLKHAVSNSFIPQLSSDEFFDLLSARKNVSELILPGPKKTNSNHVNN